MTQILMRIKQRCTINTRPSRTMNGGGSSEAELDEDDQPLLNPSDSVEGVANHGFETLADAQSAPFNGNALQNNTIERANYVHPHDRDRHGHGHGRSLVYETDTDSDKSEIEVIEVSHSTCVKAATVAILTTVNLLNYMDRYTIAGDISFLF